MIKLSMYQINEKSSHKIGEYTCKTFNNTEFISEKIKNSWIDKKNTFKRSRQEILTGTSGNQMINRLRKCSSTSIGTRYIQVKTQWNNYRYLLEWLKLKYQLYHMRPSLSTYIQFLGVSIGITTVFSLLHNKVPQT